MTSRGSVAMPNFDKGTTAHEAKVAHIQAWFRSSHASTATWVLHGSASYDKNMLKKCTSLPMATHARLRQCYVSSQLNDVKWLGTQLGCTLCE